MRRLKMTGAFLSVALGAVFVLSATAQAATSAPTAGIAGMATPAGHHAVRPAVQPVWLFFGSTYPDTSAGLAACNADGAALIADNSPEWSRWQCRLNTPHAGSYNLWVYVSGPLP
jgi:hypothetical protein